MRVLLCLLARHFIFLLLVIIVFAFSNVILHLILDNWGIDYRFFKTLYETFDSIIYLADKLLFKTGYKPNSHTGVPTDSLFAVLFLILSIAVVLLISIIWTFIERNHVKEANKRLDNYDLKTREVVRIVLALIMFHYGIIKLFLRQMPPNSIVQLLTPFGYYNKHELMWSFIGASKTFQFFLGFSECLCATLLLFRKTSLLGLMTCFAITLNICVMNFSYDVPARLLACLVMTMIVYLLTPYVKILYKILIQGNVARITFPDRQKNLKISLSVNKLLSILILLILGTNTFFTYSRINNRNKLPPIRVYHADVTSQTALSENTIIKNNIWDLAFFKPDNTLTVIYTKGNRTNFKYSIDSAAGSLSLFRYAYFNDSLPLQVYKIKRLQNENIALHSTIDSTTINLQVVSPSIFDFEINSNRKWTEKLPVYSIK
ncbi:MAG: hypothetical protein BGP13_10765 [Sphingobacteriales bacterium 40-81]|nr:MAG: hypothetical protein BGP13_10765 [Sphingobacteriales bacterium 40-81]